MARTYELLDRLRRQEPPLEQIDCEEDKNSHIIRRQRQTKRILCMRVDDKLCSKDERTRGPNTKRINFLLDAASARSSGRFDQTEFIDCVRVAAQLR